MEQFIELMIDALEKDHGSVQEGDLFREYEEWDSLAVLSIIALVKQNYDLTIPRKDFDSLLTVKDLYDYVSTHS